MSHHLWLVQSTNLREFELLVCNIKVIFISFIYIICQLSRLWIASQNFSTADWFPSVKRAGSNSSSSIRRGLKLLSDVTVRVKSNLKMEWLVFWNLKDILTKSMWPTNMVSLHFICMEPKLQNQSVRLIKWN